MTPGKLLADLEERGIRLYVEGAFLRYRGPVGAFDMTLRRQARALRQQLISDWMCLRCENVMRVLYGFEPERHCRRCFEEVR